MILEMPWLQGAVKSFSARLSNNTLPHAVLLSAPVGDGAEVLARSLAKAALCFSPELGYPCNQCKSCLLYQAETHPDYLQLEPGGASLTIKVDDIRALVERFSTTAQISKRKVAVVLRSDLMNTAASNALLKTLEEPPGDALLILVTEASKPLLPTVRSRCQPIHVGRPDKNQVNVWLASRKLPRIPAEELMETLDYQPLRIAQWLESGQQETWDHFQSLLAPVAGGKLSPVMAAAQCKDIELQDQLDWVDKKISREIHELALSGAQLDKNRMRFVDQIVELRRELVYSANVNAQLYSENLFMLWQQFHRQQT